MRAADRRRSRASTSPRRAPACLASSITYALSRIVRFGLTRHPYRQLVTERRFSKWDSFFLDWTERSEVLSSVYRAQPFVIALGNVPTSLSSPSAVLIPYPPGTAAAMRACQLHLSVVASQFNPPADTSFTRSAIDFLQGEKLLGIYMHEMVLEQDAAVTALGILEPAGSATQGGGWLSSLCRKHCGI